MKPFDLEAAKAGAKVVTRDGKPVRIVCYDLKTSRPERMIALLDMGQYEEMILCNPGSGESFSCDEHDLFMAPVKKYAILGACGGDAWLFETNRRRLFCEDEAEERIIELSAENVGINYQLVEVEL